MDESGWQFNQLICIARGGMRVGDVLSRIYDMPLAILSTISYTEKAGTSAASLMIADQMTMTRAELGDSVLLVDDLVDSGRDAGSGIRGRCRSASANHASAHRGALVQGCSVFKPDYFVEYLPDNPWIHQPFEIYDRLRPEELSARLST